MLTQNQEKYQEVLEAAENIYRQNPDWVTFFREVMGVDGTVRKAFPTFDELTAFEQSEQFEKIQKMVVRLREKRASIDADAEPTRVITVRLPKSMHEYLRTEAHDLRTSMNKLCISKLLQVIAEDKIPNERSGSTSSPAASTPPTAPRLSQGTTIPSPASQPAFGRTLPVSPNGPYAGRQPQPTPFKPAQPRLS